MTELVGRPRHAVVLGAGTMGARIALCLARSGVAVTLSSRTGATLRAAEATISAGQPGAPEPAAVRALIELTTDPDPAFPAAELVIETIREDVDDKLRLLAVVEASVGAETLITTNTSSLDLAVLSAGLARPERFAGLHWFHPADLMALVEVVPGPRTSDAATTTLSGWLTELGKAPIVLRRAVLGFVGNRLQYALIREAYALVADGVCTRDEVDRAVTHGLGPRWAAVGPFGSMDLAGLDVHLQVARSLFPELAQDTLPPAELVDLVKSGQLGAKSGSGLLGRYTADECGRLGRVRDNMLRLVAEHREGDS